VLCQLTQGSQPSMTFLFVGSSVCRWLPPDPSSQKRPCLKLGVIRLSAPRVSSIWTLVLLQGTFTPLVHAHAGRTQICWSGLAELIGVVQKLVARRSTDPLAGFVSGLWQFCHILHCVGSMLFSRFTSLIEEKASHYLVQQIMRI